MQLVVTIVTIFSIFTVVTFVTIIIVVTSGLTDTYSQLVVTIVNISLFSLL